MKLFPVVLLSAALLVSCGRKSVDIDAARQDQERLAEQEQARQQRELRERQAALDERERLLNAREQQQPATVPSSQEAPQPLPVSQPAAAAAQPQPPAITPNVSYQAFYDQLSPFGSWMELPTYGYVWQPAATVRDSRWRPYTVGHWAFTDQGWMWISDEPFGWVAYHYGRWMRTASLGWVWVPGSQWAPAWVAWRFGNDYVGWAPLPPEATFDNSVGIKQWADQQYNLGPADYTFVPASEFGDDNMVADQVPSDQTQTIYDDSNNMTNIYYDSGFSGVVCYGHNYDYIRSKSHRPLPPPLKLLRHGFEANGKNGESISGNTLQITAPRVIPRDRPDTPKLVRGRIAETRIIAPAPTPPPHGAPPTGAVADAPSNEPNTQSPATGMRIPSRMNPVPVPPVTEVQKQRDLHAIEQNQPAEQRREQAARAAAERAAREQVTREQSVHPAPPATPPTGTQQTQQPQQPAVPSRTQP